MCNILKTTNGTNINWYKYKNGKLYSTCIECFNKKLKCEFCNKELNKTYLSKHLKRCNINHDNTNNEILIIMKIMIIIIIQIILLQMMILIIMIILCSPEASKAVIEH